MIPPIPVNVNEQYYNIRIIVPVALNDGIYVMEGLHKMKTVFSKLCDRPSDINKKTGVMDIFRYKYIKKARTYE